jgi:hypothetical protein
MVYLNVLEPLLIEVCLSSLNPVGPASKLADILPCWISSSALVIPVDLLFYFSTFNPFVSALPL